VFNQKIILTSGDEELGTQRCLPQFFPISKRDDPTKDVWGPAVNKKGKGFHGVCNWGVATPGNLGDYPNGVKGRLQRSTLGQRAAGFK